MNIWSFMNLLNVDIIEDLVGCVSIWIPVLALASMCWYQKAQA